MVGHYIEETPLDQVWVEQEILAVEHRTGCDPNGLQLIHQLMGFPLGGDLSDEFVQFRPVAPTVQAIFEPLIFSQIGLVHYPAERSPSLVAVDSDRDPAVFSLTGITPVGSHARVAVADPGFGASIGRKVEKRFRHRGAGGLGLRYVHELALAGAEAVHQSSHNREHGLFAGGVVGVGNLR